VRFIRIFIMPESEDDVDPIIDGLRTTLPEDRTTIDEEGYTYTRVETDQELMDECICLGIAFAVLEEEGYDCPFDVDLIESDTIPGQTQMH
jgi:hypothetical protein